MKVSNKNRKEKLADSFDRSKDTAAKYLEDPKLLKGLQDSLNDKINSSKNRIADGLDDIYTLMRLLAAYTTGDYREIAVRSMVAVVAALVYFLNPMDLIPDFITGFGFLDDLTVLAYVIKTFKDEIDKFIDWEMNGKDVVDED